MAGRLSWERRSRGGYKITPDGGIAFAREIGAAAPSRHSFARGACSAG